MKYPYKFNFLQLRRWQLQPKFVLCMIKYKIKRKIVDCEKMESVQLHCLLQYLNVLNTTAPVLFGAPVLFDASSSCFCRLIRLAETTSFWNQYIENNMSVRLVRRSKFVVIPDLHCAWTYDASSATAVQILRGILKPHWALGSTETSLMQLDTGRLIQCLTWR